MSLAQQIKEMIVIFELYMNKELLTADISPGIGIAALKIGDHFTNFEKEIMQSEKNLRRFNNWKKKPVNAILPFEIFSGQIKLFFRTDTMTLCEIHIYKYERTIFGNHYFGRLVNLEDLNPELYHDFDHEDIVLFKEHSGIGLLLDRSEEKLIFNGISIFDPNEIVAFPE